MKSLREKLYIIIFEADTKAGKLFDELLLICILTSVLTVMLESVESVNQVFGKQLLIIEWVLTIMFTIEYAVRLFCVRHPLKYAKSFFGVVDLLSVLPSYLGMIFPSGHFLVTIRILRVLRVFRILKLMKFLNQGNLLWDALCESRHKIFVFLFAEFILTIVIGSIMYLVEGPVHGFTSIPRSVYWTVVTMTTVGYGDISPQTPLGQFLASFVMILGYAIIAVPTGIVGAQIIKPKSSTSTHVCPECQKEGHDADATYCKFCSAHLYT